ncbi:MAG TPA: peptidase S51 [Thermoanaerobaculia bacterium]|nr:peptidase S51 [Thermoanaerobaculia bacterium]
MIFASALLLASLHGPVLDLAGSSAEPAGLQAMVNEVRGCSDCNTKVDVVILRASGDNSLNDTFKALNGVATATTFIIKSREEAERRAVLRALRRAEIVWFAGGDQCNYIRWIKGTKAAKEVESVFTRGGGVGGNSAGLAIQGDVVYDSCPDVSAKSQDVLMDPFSRDASLSSDFFHWPALQNTITDTHFHERDRFGRTLVFLARTYATRHSRIDAIGVDEQTSVVVDRNGKGRVFGRGAAYLIADEDGAEVLKAATPLTDRGFKVWKFDSGSTIDFVHRPAEGFRTIDVVDGKLSADPY